MDFSTMIEQTVMPKVRHGSEAPFIIYSDGGDWHCDYTQDQYGETFDWVEGVKDKYPLALTLTGKDFAHGSYPTVYDAVLSGRMRSEFQHNLEMGAYYGNSLEAHSEGMGAEEAGALADFFCDNIASFSHEAMDYLASLERPFDALAEVCTINLATNHDRWFFNESFAMEVVDSIESAIYDRMKSYHEKPAAGKRAIDGHEEILCIRLGGKEIVLAENTKEATDLYIICDITKDTPIGREKRSNIQHTDDYLSALSEFTYRMYETMRELKQERQETRLPQKKLTAEDCKASRRGDDWEGKLLIMAPEALAPEYRSAERQLVLCTGGPGAKPNPHGNIVHIKELFSGKESRCARESIAGIADPEKLPQWAAERLDRQQPDAQSPICALINIPDAGRMGKDRDTWLKLPADAETLGEALSKIGAVGDKYAITDTKGMIGSIEPFLPSASGLDELNMLAHFLKGMEGWEIGKLDAILKSGAVEVSGAAGLINLLCDDNFTGIDVLGVSTYEELGRHREAVDGDGIPDGTGYGEYGRLCEAEEKGKLTESGYVYQRFKTEQLYDGAVPHRYQIVEAAAEMKLIAPQKNAKKPKASVLGALGKGREKVAQADAARSGQEYKQATRKRRGQEQGE